MGISAQPPEQPLPGGWSLPCLPGRRLTSSTHWRTQEEGGQQGRRGCPTCSGTGHVTCFCTRWENDASDVGCGTCRGSRRMTCAACRGGGTAVPIEAKLYIRSEPRIRPEADYK